MSAAGHSAKKAKSAAPDDRRSGQSQGSQIVHTSLTSGWIFTTPSCCSLFLPCVSGRLRTKVRHRSVIDPETRRLVALARLNALEQDNYEENALAHAAAAGDGAYEDEEEEVEQGGSKGKKRKRGGTAVGSRGAASAGADSLPAAKGTERAAKATVHRTRNLDFVVAEEVKATTNSKSTRERPIAKNFVSNQQCYSR